MKVKVSQSFLPGCYLTDLRVLPKQVKKRLTLLTKMNKQNGENRIRLKKEKKRICLEKEKREI